MKINADEADAAKAKLQGVGKQADETGGHLAQLAGGAVVLGAVTAAGGILVGQIQDIAKVTGEHQAAEAQLAAVIKSTGDVSGVTAGMVNKLSDSLSTTTTYSDDTTTSAQNMLLTFTKIHADVFPATTKAVLDMATAMHHNLGDTAIQVGKALEDPVKGVTALQREGVKLTDSQKELVKHLVATGDTAGAQKVILAELNKEFGGSAEAAGKTTPGALQILQNELEKSKRQIGDALSPTVKNFTENVLEPLVRKITDGVTYAVSHGTEIWHKWWPEIVIAGGIIGGLLVIALVAATIAAWNFAAGVIAATWPIALIVAAIALVTAGVVLLITHWKDLTDWFGKLDFVQSIVAGFEAIWDVIKKVIDKIGDFLGVLGKVKDGIGNVPVLGGVLKGIGFAAEGDPSTTGGPYIVGEKGPELILPPAGSKILPLPATVAASAPSGGYGGARASGPVHVHLHLNGREFAEAIMPDFMPGMVAHIRTATGLRL